MDAAVGAQPEFDRASSPSPGGLDRFARAVGAKARPRTLRRLRGGLDASTHVIAINDERLVLKRFPVGTMVERESATNMKQTWVTYGRSLDWTGVWAEGEDILRHAIQVKNIWVPYGD